MTRLLFALSALIAISSAYAGLRQQTSFVLREEEPAWHWPRSNAFLMRSYIPGRGLYFYGGRSDFAAFAGGGPGSGK